MPKDKVNGDIIDLTLMMINLYHFAYIVNSKNN